MRVVSLPGGRHRFISSPEELDVRVDDSVLKCVGFLGRLLHRDSKSWDGEPVGTGFFVSIRSAVGDGLVFHCFVTAKHVVEGLKGQEPYVVINLKSGGKKALVLGSGVRWWFHPTDRTADVAVMPFAIQPDHDIVSVGVEDLFLTKENFGKYKIGVGDQVFITGLFSPADGRKRNIPIVRHGNVAMLPTEPIQTDYGYAEVYLIEARSIGGLSGSPVFVRETVAMRVKVRGEQVLVGATARQQLLGLMHGHWDIKESEMNNATFTMPDEGRGVNMGIGIVVPATKILETIRQPEIEQMRKKVEDDHRKSALSPRTDSARSAEYANFEELAKRVVAVPKAEIDRREAKFRADRKNRPRVGPKPKR
jgi:hypothetical protein